ncbi:hypothetical protein RIR_jg4524.t1 [Rhizophagus irregularis DAOM 181602=DAOM 197198]|nr:hypothetical protein RIR_jg4524.t1 [Rhizophagus irregularis DAOM 181602=DAOM 197198]
MRKKGKIISTWVPSQDTIDVSQYSLSLKEYYSKSLGALIRHHQANKNDSCINHRLQYSRMKNLMNIVISSSAKMKKNELKVPRHYTWFTTSNFHAGIDFRRAALMSDLMALADQGARLQKKIVSLQNRIRLNMFF